MNDTESQATPEEIAEGKRKCWFQCNKTAWLEDWTGYRFCFTHWYQVFKGKENLQGKWFYIKTTKFYNHDH